MATNYFTSLPAPEIRNALVNFQPMTNAFEAVRDQNNENRNALMRQQQMDAQQEERTYQRGRDQVADQRQYAKQLGDFGVAVQREQDPARRQALWNRTLAFHKQYFPGQTLTPEEMDINTGPTLLAAEVGKVFDPRDDKIKDLEIQAKQAQIGKLNREAAGGGETPSNVREWQYYQSLPPEKQQQYLTMKRSIPFLDQGTQFAQPNLAVPGQVVQTVPKNVAETERQKALGKSVGDARASLEGDLAKAQVGLDTIEKIRSHPGRDSATGYGALLPEIAFTNTQGAGFLSLLNQAKGQAFLEAFQSLKGGGQITEVEGKKATDAIARLERNQTKEDFEAALNDLRAVIEAGMNRSKQRAGVLPRDGVNDLKSKYGLE